ncbi:hypothetical protein ACOSP7_007039 [Xanthoceras sorbifolium]
MRRRSGDVSLRRLDFGWCIAACYLATGDLKEEKPPLEATDEWSSLFIYFFQIFFNFICLLFCGVLSGGLREVEVDLGRALGMMASSKIIEVGQLVAEDVLFQQHVADKDQTGGPDSVGTGYSVVVDQRRTRADAKEISSPKRRKWKHLARAKAGDSGMHKGSVVVGKRPIMFKDEGISDCKRSRSGCDESNGKAERNMRAN